MRFNYNIEILGKSYDLDNNILNLSDQLLGNDGIYELSEKIVYKAMIESLFLIQNNIYDESLKQLLNSLKIIDSIKELDLSYNFINGDCFDYFKDYLLNTKSLNYLNLSNNNIKEENVLILCEGIKHNKSLKEINLFNNDLNTKSIKALRDALIVNKGIEKVSVNFYTLGLYAAEEFLKIYNYRNALNIIYK
ncbi:hypothetical protein [Candidatus Absconditicoccus praedator]|uniref:hypothetical protein n=1 Tax=Candidatus Absconditicoccus praedator TaxID=2735562 RepID=UPI001E5BCB71|nr:hypothetical protein [Candidatus Absconditicoccus praedator]UFX83095.1 hypothetical protein HLG78_03100 [Candidatus Absconditicoccus praedator]